MNLQPQPIIGDQIHVVLVRPEDNLNIGSVARAMMNLGFQHLHLVAPRHYDPARAATTARWATALLERVQIHSRLTDCLAGFQEVIGSSPGRYQGRPCHLLLSQWLERIAGLTLPPTAILFGPEDNGLTSAELDQCRWVIQIPSSPDYPAFNLAQSVLIVLYELSKLRLHASATCQVNNLPTWNEYYQLDRILIEVLTRCGYLRKGTPKYIPGLLKGLFRRLGPDGREMAVLLGVFSRINRSLQRVLKE